ncbi:PREDICTED: lysophosphatidic acid phosphatase type 6 [Thamnophis sirtalis]|uniref:Lysophosphatidic acid phosphatase type 6 n=1 Tax=Thamnophis sirtalis TaxID=35019 RepID=A0A6I9Z7H7_9SAUR|nr:PREDICTED: lysophosphatidic acid phosphatase type 6 [Thamnophis sirtalis]
MDLWARVGMVGALSCYAHRKKNVLAQAAKSDGESGSGRPELKLVQVLFRHGARTPLRTIPGIEQVDWDPTLLEIPAQTKFPYIVTNLTGGPRPFSPYEENYKKTVLKGGVIAGQLTKVGMQQMFTLGERLRKRYIEESNFLSSSYKSSEVLVRSTNIDRNLESTRCLLAGLYREQKEGAVTIVTDKAESEILYPNPGNCQQLKLMHRDGWASLNLHQDLLEDLKNIKQKLGISNEQKVDFIVLLDNIFAEQAHDLPSYPVLKNSMQLIEQRAIDSFFYITKNNSREVLQMTVGPLLNVIEDNIMKAIEPPSSDIKTRKLILYAVHDVTLFPLLVAMGVFNSKWPPYAADVTLELYQHSKDWFIRLIYNGEELIPRGCKDGLCPLEDFLNALSVYSTEPQVYKMICSQTEETVLQHN